jgi:hypothetical protein
MVPPVKWDFFVMEQGILAMPANQKASKSRRGVALIVKGERQSCTLILE